MKKEKESKHERKIKKKSENRTPVSTSLRYEMRVGGLSTSHVLACGMQKPARPHMWHAKTAAPV